jgi:hypothetical protein
METRLFVTLRINSKDSKRQQQTRKHPCASRCCIHWGAAPAPLAWVMSNMSIACIWAADNLPSICTTSGGTWGTNEEAGDRATDGRAGGATDGEQVRAGAGGTTSNGRVGAGAGGTTEDERGAAGGTTKNKQAGAGGAMDDERVGARAADDK